MRVGMLGSGGPGPHVPVERRQQIEAVRERKYALAQELKLPKELSKEEAKEG